jgi:hypothetical protein
MYSNMILFILFMMVLGIFGLNFVSAQTDTITNIDFLQTGVLDTVENQYHISNEINIREFRNGEIIRISGLTIEGFPYITYSKILEFKTDTRGMIFVDGKFIKLSFEEKLNQETIQIEKNNELLILVQYTQRVYSENNVQIDIKTFYPEQNILNDFNQNYGFISNTNISVTILDEDKQEFYSSSENTDDKGLLEIQFPIPENYPKQTFEVTVNAENENSKSSKTFQIFSLGEESDDGSSSTP